MELREGDTRLSAWTHGRVLLADEVGLGKTVEAGMVLKEYALRGMAERMLILVPASLVGQWRDEMAEKFGLAFATSHDPLLRSDPGQFWAQPRVITRIFWPASPMTWSRWTRRITCATRAAPATGW